jgi:hypothetical protein
MGRQHDFEDDMLLIDEEGFQVLPDGTRVLKDGQSIRVPLYLMDGKPNPALDPAQRALALSFADQQRAKRFGLSDAADLHRPGHRYLVDEKARDAKAAAYQDYEDSQAEAWRSPPISEGSRRPRGAQPGGSCVVDGRPGHLRDISGELLCIADNSILGEDHALNDREAAHAEHRHYLENAWRNPDADVSDHRPVRRADQMPTRDAVEQAYQEHDEWLRNAWKNPT